MLTWALQSGVWDNSSVLLKTISSEILEYVLVILTPYGNELVTLPI